ncbi:uncharacterized protein Z518_00924 [Rhinocladiella mackenziei CBS 650.93]|uniref:Rhinocladiella mackenziei CBS 650.93 unplaced genomic scaffold supercont1.1, whole genome shotgun sequence n=1 Tax=Rhinocladiella mackenziei CBS 650.93 TaxID=1442369 RepID=A0A0D2HGP1_9EURO|nr:uncharacterized protein Z518_00924 [Rhinocladiella mackenziei CBS 650.93]KIX09843.1 hypothetical protein Z518_00924 [Rhinocladiella mackenziei CBS 650.93]
MTDQQIIDDNPIRKGLDGFYTTFKSLCEDRSLSCTSDGCVNSARRAFSLRPAPFEEGHGSLRSNLLGLISTVASSDFDFDRVKPLLNAALIDKPDDTLIWDQVHNAVTDSILPLTNPMTSQHEQLRQLL